MRAIYGAPLPPFPEREFRALARDRQVDVVLLRSTPAGPVGARPARGLRATARRRGHARLAGARHLAALARVSRMTHRIAVLAGDGVGPEVVDEARRCVDELAFEIEWSDLDWGSDHWVTHGVMMPRGRRRAAARFDAILLGAVGRPDIPDHVTLWGLLLPIRQRLDLWANVRPVRLLEGVPCALAGRAPGDIDMVFVRENSEGEYSGVGGRAHQGHPERGRHRDGRVHARRHRARRRARVQARRRAPRSRDERDQVQRVALRLRALGRGRRRRGRAPSRHPLRARARRRARGAHGAAARTRST